MRGALFRSVGAAAAIVSLMPTPARAAPGDLDSSFGSGGRAGAGGGTGFAVAVQSDGKILVAGCTSFFCEDSAEGEFKVVRLGPDGLRDQTFGTNGIVTTRIGPISEAHALAVQPDGKIVVAGCTECTFGGAPSFFALARYGPDGSLDDSFGEGGVAVLSSLLVRTLPVLFSRADVAYGVAVQPDGKIVVGGSSGRGFGVARLHPDGTRDESFGGHGPFGPVNRLEDPGFVGTNFRGGIGMALALQPDGKIVLAGTVEGSFGSDAGFIRYMPDGSLDQAFGSGGGASIAFRSSFRAVQGMALQPDGAIVVAGQTMGPGGGDFAVGRLLPQGAPDPSFGSEGLVATDFSGGNDVGEGIAVSSDGRLVVTGYSSAGGRRIAVARYLPDGTLDTSFGAAGTVLSGLGHPRDVALQPDGKILVSGYAGSPAEFSVMRFWDG